MGSNVPPRMPVTGSAARVVDELRVSNPDRLATAGAVLLKSLGQSPAIERPLKARQRLRVAEIGHRQQPLQLVPRYREPALDWLDHKGLGRRWTAVDLERGDRPPRRLGPGAVQRRRGTPHQLPDPLSGGG